jgi:hypothetical protein
MSLLTLAPKAAIQGEVVKRPEYVLSLVLIGLGVVLILLALIPHHPILKAAAIAWVVLP